MAHSGPLRRLQPRRRNPESGQTIVLVVLIAGLFLLGFIAFAVDFSGLWFQRQVAQSAADAACTAAAMDMLVEASGGTVSSGFTTGTPYNCSSAPTSTPCTYASFNGVAPGTLVANTEGNDVAVSFPSSVTGATTPPVILAPTPFVQVDVTRRVKTFFAPIFTGSKTQDVHVAAVCGLVQAKAPIPIIVLHPSLTKALDVQGTPDIIITGGPQRSIQVNSSNTTATNIGGSATVDLHLGGPDGTGSDLGTFGGPHNYPVGNFLPGSTGHWIQPSSPIQDPFKNLRTPDLPTTTCTGATGTACRESGVIYGPTATVGAGGVPGTDPYCEVSLTDTHNSCTRYSPGYYPDGILVKNENAIFRPGLYYLGGDLTLDANSVGRPAKLDAPAGETITDGTLFYFVGTANLHIKANSGTGKSNDPLLLFPRGAVQCSGGAAPTPALTADLPGNVFLAPCNGTYGDPLGQYRGMLFMHDRITAVSAEMYGGGGLLTNGNMYFHQNGTFGSDMTLQGGTGSSTRIIGEIVTDKLILGGNSQINMQLNPNAAYNVLKVSMLR